MLPRKELIEFKSSAYYRKDVDDDTLENKPCVHLLLPGRELVEEYYRDKYSTNITFHDGDPDLEPFQDEDIFDLEDIRKQYTDHRHAFIFEDSNRHSIPIVYIKENECEAFLYANSLGIKQSAERFCKELNEQLSIPVYGIMPGRQRDQFSCHADALVLSRDITRLNSSGEYAIQNILSRLRPLEQKSKSRRSRKSSKSVGFFAAKFPNELLFSAQRPDFIKYNRDDKVKIIHTRDDGQVETLDEFLKRYTEQVTCNRDVSGSGREEKRDASAYLRIKGLKYIKIIEIQFYIKQFKEYFGDSWTDEARIEFVKAAKKEFAASNSLHAWASKVLLDFEEKITNENDISNANYSKVLRMRGG